MENRVKLLLNEYYEELMSRKELLEERRVAIESREETVLIRKKASKGNWYYYAKEKGPERHQRYLGAGNNQEVNEIKELRFIDKTIGLIEKNIETVDRLANRIQRTDFESVNKMLPDTYRWAELSYGMSKDKKARKWKEKMEVIKAANGEYRADDLKVWTDDGSKVRSKSEGLIYNYLLSRGVTFVYEFPLRLRSRTIYPDFTILSELDYETEVIVEHQGMMDIDSYKGRFADKVQRYIREGFTPGVNVFFTFDDSNGGLNMQPIEDIVRTHIKVNTDTTI